MRVYIPQIFVAIEVWAIIAGVLGFMLNPVIGNFLWFCSIINALLFACGWIVWRFFFHKEKEHGP
jgi:nitric oxide reductase large subunit